MQRRNFVKHVAVYWNFLELGRRHYASSSSHSQFHLIKTITIVLLLGYMHGRRSCPFDIAKPFRCMIMCVASQKGFTSGLIVPPSSSSSPSLSSLACLNPDSWQLLKLIIEQITFPHNPLTLPYTTSITWRSSNGKATDFWSKRNTLFRFDELPGHNPPS
jgi:hypothetical protein